MFINDVGEVTWEEINDGIAGSNYGWPNTEGVTSNPAFRSPLFAYQHGVSATTGCAIAGGAFYNPATVRFPAEFRREIFLRGSVQWLDQGFRSGDGNGVGLCDEHLARQWI